MSKMTDEQRELIDQLSRSVSRLCHQVIARRLEQFFEVIGEELEKFDKPPMRTALEFIRDGQIPQGMSPALFAERTLRVVDENSAKGKTGGQ